MSPRSWRKVDAFITCILLHLSLESRCRAASAAIKEATLDLRAKITLESEKSPRKIAGTLKWKISQDFQGLDNICLYLPYSDPTYGDGWSIARRFDLAPQKYSSVVFSGGSTVVKAGPEISVVEKTPYLLKISKTAPGNTIEIYFESRVPRLPNTDDEEWFYDGFYPQLLHSCPDQIEASEYFRPVTKNKINAQITSPPNWQIAAPGSVVGDNQYRLTGKQFAFGLARGLKKSTLKIADIQVEIVFKSDGFLEVLSTIRQALTSHKKWFGPFPFSRLVILETADLQKLGHPGIIAINRPKQSLFKSLQSDFLNWRHWVITSMLASQWFGGCLTTVSPDDQWLIAGFVDFATLEAIQLLTLRSNFFNSFERRNNFFKFSYLQMQELTAALLKRSAPLTILTDENLKTVENVDDQHPLAFIRHALALRQIKSVAGDAIFANFLKNYVQKRHFHSISPRDFYLAFLELPSPFSATRRAALATYLKSWWTARGWADFKLEEFEKERLADGRWLAKVEVAQKGELQLPALIKIEDKAERSYFARIEDADAGGTWHTAIVTDSEPRLAVIDPQHDVFDEDRFNNSSTFPSLKFFPGSADTLEDDAYTLFWLPYPFRRPGEGVSIGIMAALFRYLQSSLYLRVETMPSENRSGFMVHSEYQISRYALSLNLAASQNYEGFRVAEVSVERSRIFKSGPRLSLGLKLRHRQIVGVPETSHRTYVGAASFKPGSASDPCSVALWAENEEAPKDFTSGFTYSRRKGIVEGRCSIRGGIDMFSRGFVGDLKYSGDIPKLALFQPEDLVEARLRLDIKGLERVEKIVSLSNDLLLPLVLPLPGDTLILSRQIKARLFYDIGRSIDQETIYRDGGAGIHVPFGGELAGVGSFALTRLSILAVLYSNADGEVSRKPRILFDLAGEL